MQRAFHPGLNILRGVIEPSAEAARQTRCHNQDKCLDGAGPSAHPGKLRSSNHSPTTGKAKSAFAAAKVAAR